MIPLFRGAALGALLSLALAATAEATTLARYVLLGEDGAPVARVITDAEACPVLAVDGRRARMALRAGPETLPLRPTASPPADSKPAAFPVRVCERALPRTARRVRLEGRLLPLPPRRADRILVVGDTGCRVKAADKAYQACNDPKAWPFAEIARRAAAWKPDVVLHVGDYLYRENACPAGTAACAGPAWGYGWDAWQADFFAPAAPLLAAAPWIVDRGNHENCERAGQGWWRLLDVRPLVSGRDCVDPARDFDNDDAAPYAVPLGGGAQVIVADLSIAGTKSLADDDPRKIQFERDYDAIAAFAGRGTFTFLTDHKPILGVGATDKKGEIKLYPGNGAIQSAFAARDPALLPAGVDALLSGHIHLWEQASFGGKAPSQFIAGFSGTQEDIVPLPRALPADFEVAPGLHADAFSSWIDGFGYMTLERAGPRRWHVKVWSREGEVVNRCEIDGRKSWCEVPQVEVHSG
ncbi:MAG: metallophosphoesterase [Caulobacteraceae bacterium]